MPIALALRPCGEGALGDCGGVGEWYDDGGCEGLRGMRGAVGGDGVATGEAAGTTLLRARAALATVGSVSVERPERERRLSGVGVVGVTVGCVNAVV
jgi:hypothetical protein